MQTIHPENIPVPIDRVAQLEEAVAQRDEAIYNLEQEVERQKRHVAYWERRAMAAEAQ